MNFRQYLSPEAQRRMAEADGHYEYELIKFRNMNTENLISSTKYYTGQMKEPWKHEFNRPTYDSVFWYVILPELLRRLKEGTK